MNKYIPWILLGLLLLWIILNFQNVTVKFLLFNIQMPLAFVIMVSAAMGGAAMFVFQLFSKKKKDKDEEEKD